MTNKKKKLYITTPIYYPSGKPHIGHAYTTVLADVIARYKRAIGYDVFFQTGLDEHGEKIANTALKQKKEIKVMLDEMVVVFKGLWKQLDISYDYFIRTTDKQHEQTISKIFSTLIEKDCIYLGEWASYYCVNCEENYTKSQIEKKGDGKMYCQFGHELTYKKEPSYFLKVSKYQKWIKNVLTKSKNLIYPQSRVKELINSFINEGLTDLSVSRTSINWGIKVKENPKHVIYVWIDALFNYLTSLGYLSKDDKLFKKYWQNNDVQRVHLMSKEIMRFHCIYWPIMLHMLNLNLPTKVISHGWVITNQGKMSKSLGNVIDPKMYLDDFGSDALRYFLIKELSIEQDSVFSHDNFVKVYNGDLANNYGNMITRVWGMMQRYTDYKVPALSKKLNNLDKQVIKYHQDLIDNYKKYVDEFKIKDLLIKIQSSYDVLNKYIENVKPWQLFKNKQTETLNNCLNIIFHFMVDLNILLSPILVKASANFFKTFKLKSKDGKKTIAFGPYYLNKDSKARYEMYADHNFKPKNESDYPKIIFARR